MGGGGEGGGVGVGGGDGAAGERGLEMGDLEEWEAARDTLALVCADLAAVVLRGALRLHALARGLDQSSDLAARIGRARTLAGHLYADLRQIGADAP